MPEVRAGMCRQVEVSVPEDAFEMNYIFTDGEGATDNNQGKNYMTVVQSGMTAEAWEEKAIDRQVTPSRIASASVVNERGLWDKGDHLHATQLYLQLCYKTAIST